MAVTFDNGADYAESRPTYPPELGPLLAAQAPRSAVALDVGCGTGQLTEILTDEFATTIGTDISLSQVRAARGTALYTVADASSLPLKDHSVDLVTVAQAAHWIEVEPFYEEVRRVATPGALIALISYGLCIIDDAETDRIFQEFYAGEFHDFWDPRRIHVETGLSRLPFPFERVAINSPDIIKSMTVHDFLGYVETWSASTSARKDGHGYLLDRFAENLELVWGSVTRQVRWPVTVIAGVTC
ncbi:class I SAM-dependent methyltransferase [Corynebacterium breve]|uniref:Class I SAM-dependent methyltransferase n=1 Tax=Corynebacterium breve TaxID=3049799 RepID=A0ABY8VHP1_9CORY|nr:class I SAM-dependent methyltransferase [Corynebacterium breve]WIM68153.1 class I SAM-dependent methyltransferase [Corynebacterium breve]